MSIKSFLLRKMLASKLKGVPEAEQEKLFNLVEKHPDLFQKIATKVQERMATGKDQMTASMEVMKEHKDELQRALG